MAPPNIKAARAASLFEYCQVWQCTDSALVETVIVLTLSNCAEKEKSTDVCVFGHVSYVCILIHVLDKTSVLLINVWATFPRVLVLKTTIHLQSGWNVNGNLCIPSFHLYI